MKRFLQLIVLLMFVGISAANTQEQTQREAERKVLDAKLERSIGNEFPMAYFIDYRHGTTYKDKWHTAICSLLCCL